MQAPAFLNGNAVEGFPASITLAANPSSLVVDVTNFEPYLEFQNARENLHLVERWTRRDADTMEYAVTIEDPTFLAKPFQFTCGYRRNPQYRIMEYICDNNRHYPGAEGGVDLDVSSK